MRILLVYPGHAVSTIDVAEGYEAALMELGHCVQAYEYHAAIHFYGVSIEYYRQEYDDGFAPFDDAYMVLASEHVAIDAVDFVPDVVLIVNGFMLHRRAYDLLHRLQLPLALLLTESPYLDRQQVVMMEKGHIAAAFTNDLLSVEPLFEQSAGVRTVYLPHSYRAKRHRPRKEPPGRYSTDVFFHGTLWPERVALLEPLLDLPYNVAIAGIDPELKDVEDTQKLAGTMIHNEELAFWYNGTKIAINHNRTTIGTDCDGNWLHIEEDCHSLGPRAFEISACGTFQLCDNKRPELEEVFGDSVATYADKEDLLAKVDYFMTHEDEREEMAQEALTRVQDCSFVRRAEEILVPVLEDL